MRNSAAKFVAPQQLIKEWICVVLLAALSLANDEALNFAVQVDPVVFLQEPVSTVAVVGSSLQLSCQARVKPLISGFRLPSIEWRHNGSVISSQSDRIDISSNVSFGISALSVHDARPDDAGRYECVANDGHLVIGTGAPRYRTISKRAVVEIINLKVVNVSVLTGEPLMLDCGTALYSDVTLAWFHNETSVFLSGQRWHQLSNGSLLVYSAMEEDSGEWMCVRTDRQGRNTNTSNTVVHVTQDTYSGPSLVIINAPISPTPETSSFVVHCLTAPDPMAHVVWKRSQGNGLVVTTNNSHDLNFENFNSSQSDHYTCELLNSTASNSVQLTLTAIPNITNQLPVQDMIITRDDDSILLTCSTDGVPAPTVRWFKDGQPINQHLYNSTTGILNAFKAELNNRLYGVYQCFAENSVGQQYATIRTLIERFANPPGMVSCSVRGVRSGPVEFTVSWAPPVLTGKGNIRYVVSYLSDYFGDLMEGTEAYDYSGNTTTFELSNPGPSVDIFIHLFRPVIGPQAVCVIDPALRFLNNQPIPLTLDFEQGNVTAQWLYSRISGTPSARNVQVNGSCVHGIDVFKYSDFLSDFGNMHKAVVFTDLPNGTVCHFNGSYRVDISPSYSLYEEERQSFSVFPIPLSSGHVAQLTPNSEENGFALGLACNNSTVQLLWTSSRKFRAELESLNVTGLCIDASGYEQQHNLWIGSNTIANTSGSSSLLLSLTGMQSSTLCGFTATGIMKLNSSLQALPVQCIVNEYSPNFTVIVDHDDDVISSVIETSSIIETSSVLRTSSIIETSFVSTATPHSALPYNSDTVVAVSTSVAFIVLGVMFTAVLITMVLLCARRKYSHASQYFEAVIFRDSLDNQITITIGDNVSVKTDVQPLDNEECFDEQPDGSNNNMWLFSERRLHDSGCIMEPPQLVCSKLDHSGSSGYGSSYTPDSIVSSSTNYHKTIDQDLPNEQHIIREESQSPVRSFSFCQSDPVDQTNPQTIIPYPSSNDHTMLRTNPEESSLPLTCSQCHSEVTVSKWHQGSTSIASIGCDQLSQSSDESSDYCINCLKCDHCGHDNCVYVDEKGYIRFKIVTN